MLNVSNISSYWYTIYFYGVTIKLINHILLSNFFHAYQIVQDTENTINKTNY